MELRCASGILHGKIVDGCLEVRCKSNRCGHRSGTIVLHRYDLLSGELVKTIKVQDPTITSTGGTNAARRGVSLRHA